MDKLCSALNFKERKLNQKLISTLARVSCPHDNAAARNPSNSKVWKTPAFRCVIIGFYESPWCTIIVRPEKVLIRPGFVSKSVLYL